MLELTRENLKMHILENINFGDLDDMYYYGLRFENKNRNVGDVICEYSKDNESREDERDFPAYGTEEYEALPELDGVSVYELSSEKQVEMLLSTMFWTETMSFDSDHAYIVRTKNEYKNGPDEYELLFVEPEVVCELETE